MADDYYNQGSAVIDNDGNVSYNGDIAKDKTAVFVMGYPGSGKTSTVVNPLSQYFKARVLDVDDIKNAHVGGTGGIE